MKLTLLILAVAVSAIGQPSLPVQPRRVVKAQSPKAVQLAGKSAVMAVQSPPVTNYARLVIPDLSTNNGAVGYVNWHTVLQRRPMDSTGAWESFYTNSGSSNGWRVSISKTNYEFRIYTEQWR